MTICSTMAVIQYFPLFRQILHHKRTVLFKLQPIGEKKVNGKGLNSKLIIDDLLNNLFSWERDNKPYRLNGFQFTGNFENEPRQSAHQKRQLKADISEYDAQEFKNTLRIIKFNVCYYLI